MKWGRADFRAAGPWRVPGDRRRPLHLTLGIVMPLSVTRSKQLSMVQATQLLPFTCRRLMNTVARWQKFQANCRAYTTIDPRLGFASYVAKLEKAEAICRGYCVPTVDYFGVRIRARGECAECGDDPNPSGCASQGDIHGTGRMTQRQQRPTAPFGFAI
ncbi:hypothetical protein CMUS01_04783 [Colletotrichum musicola]|uniref:Uncharacterized protein n=1 Tax=Colletotrichum musicola TaxID=2175873 RepID=A0A8H6NMF7_9PEZI|nr:hypothetical protein CMUS01_04783 [Colletotrichum musicola]